MSRFEVEIKINFNSNWGKYECKNASINEIDSLKIRIRSIISYNSNYQVTITSDNESEQSSLISAVKVLFDDTSNYFPGILPEEHSILFDPKDGPIVSNYEVHVKCTNEDDCMKVANFIHYQLAGGEPYKNNKILLSIDDDKKGILLIIDGELCNRPLLIPISDDFVMKSSELY